MLIQDRLEELSGMAEDQSERMLGAGFTINHRAIGQYRAASAEGGADILTVIVCVTRGIDVNPLEPLEFEYFLRRGLSEGNIDLVERGIIPCLGAHKDGVIGQNLPEKGGIGGQRRIVCPDSQFRHKSCMIR